LLATMQRDNTEWWAYPCKCLTFGCLATTGVSNFRLPNNDGIRHNTSQYVVCLEIIFVEFLLRVTKAKPLNSYVRQVFKTGVSASRHEICHLMALRPYVAMMNCSRYCFNTMQNANNIYG
jgi:hypothetical protein